IPNVRHWQVGASGTGCVLIHRRVLEAVGERWATSPWPWFQYSPWLRTDPDTGEQIPDVLGEDYTFFLRAQAEGFPCFVDTTIEAGHIKKRILTSRDFWATKPFEEIPPKNYVVIPTKGKVPKYLKRLVNDLVAQGEADELFVVDNGMKPDLRDWLASRATLIPAEGAGIHRMWNLGVMAALSRHPKANIAFLNDDIRIGEKFLSELAEPLRDDDHLIAVCPNYDGRDQIVDVLPLEGICGERYDGTGG